MPRSTSASAASSTELDFSPSASTSPASNTPGSARSTPGAVRSSNSASPASPSSTMSEPSEQLLLDESMSSPAASPARESLRPESERASATPKPFCGERCSEPFASFDPDTCSWRTSRISLISDPLEGTPETLPERYMQTWPRSVSILSGMCFQQQPSVPLTSVRGSSPLLPTPTASDGERESETFGRGNSTLKGALKLLPTPKAEPRGPASKRGRNAQGGPGLNEAIRLLPTPRADCRDQAPRSPRKGWRPSLMEATVKLLPTPHGMPKEGQNRRPGPSGNELGFAVGSLLTGESSDPLSSVGSGSTDAHLSPWFVEWMMGAPEGWSDPACPLSATEFACRLGFSSAATSSNASGSE